MQAPLHQCLPSFLWHTFRYCLKTTPSQHSAGHCSLLPLHVMFPQQMCEPWTNAKLSSNPIYPILLGYNILLTSHFPVKLTEYRVSWTVCRPRHLKSIGLIHLSYPWRPADQTQNTRGLFNRAMQNSPVHRYVQAHDKKVTFVCSLLTRAKWRPIWSSKKEYELMWPEFIITVELQAQKELGTERRVEKGDILTEKLMGWVFSGEVT